MSVKDPLFRQLAISGGTFLAANFLAHVISHIDRALLAIFCFGCDRAATING
jgi:hypothetical protein